MIICLGNQKGGCGKTTIATNLAVKAADAGLKCLLIDADPQASAMDFRALRGEKGDLPQFQACAIITPTIHIDIKSFTGFDLIIIDAGGRDTAVFRSAILASDLVIIPVLPSQYDIWAAKETIDVLSEAQAFKPIQAKLLMNQMIAGARVSREVKEALKEFDLPVLSTSLGARVDFKQSAGSGLGVCEFAGARPAGEEMQALWAELKIERRR